MINTCRALCSARIRAVTFLHWKVLFELQTKMARLASTQDSSNSRFSSRHSNDAPIDGGTIHLKNHGGCIFPFENIWQDSIRQHKHWKETQSIEVPSGELLLPLVMICSFVLWLLPRDFHLIPYSIGHCLGWGWHFLVQASPYNAHTIWNRLPAAQGRRGRGQTCWAICHLKHFKHHMPPL